MAKVKYSKEKCARSNIFIFLRSSINSWEKSYLSEATQSTMLEYLRTVNKSVLMVLVFVFSFVTLLSSKWLLSISLILLIPLAVLSVYQQSDDVGWKKIAGDRFQFYRSFPPYWGFSILFFVIFLSGVFFGFSEYLADRLRIKLPMLLAPFLFAFLSPLSKKYYKAWALSMILIATISLGIVLGNYLFSYDDIQLLISRGGSIPTPISHIRYSVFIAFAMVLAIWFALDDEAFLGKNWKVTCIVFSLLLFIGLHILSVRSGLVAAYIGLIVSLLHWMFSRKRWFLGLGLILFLGLTPFVAYKNIDSFKSKIDYSLHDYNMYRLGEGDSYSDGSRLQSMQVGWELFKSNPIFGIGVGNFRKEVIFEYKKYYAGQAPKMPHNQFLSIMASTGIVGLMFSLIALLFPLFYRRQYRHLPMLSFYLMILSSMLVENTIETSVGLTLFLLPVLIMTNYLIGQRD